MVLKNISPGCGIRASLMLFLLFYCIFNIFSVTRFTTLYSVSNKKFELFSGNWVTYGSLSTKFNKSGPSDLELLSNFYFHRETKTVFVLSFKYDFFI